MTFLFSTLEFYAHFLYKLYFILVISYVQLYNSHDPFNQIALRVHESDVFLEHQLSKDSYIYPLFVPSCYRIELFSFSKNQFLYRFEDSRFCNGRVVITHQADSHYSFELKVSQTGRISLSS